ncbi:Gypsy retrotransposon integrase-like protein 1 [Knufia fluminis]|uniref:Gypsy retrotransposon integrase-like protein 1 n=1 Tax=Knufia fluminis TaxID=191047 RepID=A0AAN8EDF6_9EURO|nr:Gypsy retrotransposon integrase-like protein 1 [Knufia fluminis]
MAESRHATPIEATQKKRSGKRTARACDECRMRKSKCDGLQPCEACQSTDRYCTYNLSAGRSTGSGTRIRILEDRLRRARAYLNEAQKRTPSLAHVDFDALLGPTDESARSERQPVAGSEDDDQDHHEKLESMMDSYGQMSTDTNGIMERDFYGAASGLAWIQRARNYFGDSDSGGSTEIEDDNTNKSAAVQLFDAPLPTKQTLQLDTADVRLPPRETATKLLRVVFTQVYPMFHFMCEQEFHESTDRIYQLDPHQYKERDHLFLLLLHLVMALGHLFSKEEHDRQGCWSSVSQGMRHFVAARLMLDIAHLRTLVSLQTVIALILFLISTARMASGHAFLGVACAAAMRQGLHFRSAHEASLTASERRVRRKVFWAVMNLDMYVSGILGLPHFMDLTAVDPAIDLTIDAALKEANTDNHLSSANGLATAASAKHIELMRIVCKGQQALYPKPHDPPDSTKRNGTISVSVTKLQGIETQFRDWAQSLDDIISYPGDSTEIQSIKYEMYVCYYFTQIVLYRAFLHYLAKQHEDKSVGQRQLSYARTCVRMAAKVVEVSIEHQQKGLLCPASWPSIYTVFISVVCLIFSYATREEGTAAPEAKENIENGVRLLACTACTTDTGSVRCLEVLRRLIKRVSYAVDVDLDQICAETKPCCTMDFTPTKPKARALNVEELYNPAIGAGSQDSGAPSSASQVSSTSVFAGGGQGWSLSPDVTMARPFFKNVDGGTQGVNMPSYLQGDEEMMEVPYGGVFSFPNHEFHAAAMDLGHPGSSRIGLQQPSAGDSSGQPSMPPRLSAHDIAAFMHINPVDEPFYKPSRGDHV